MKAMLSEGFPFISLITILFLNIKDLFTAWVKQQIVIAVLKLFQTALTALTLTWSAVLSAKLLLRTMKGTHNKVANTCWCFALNPAELIMDARFLEFIRCCVYTYWEVEVFNTCRRHPSFWIMAFFKSLIKNSWTGFKFSLNEPCISCAIENEQSVDLW